MKSVFARCALAAALAIAAHAGEPLEALVPDTTLFLLRVKSGSGLAEKWRSTAYYAFWNHPETRRVMDAPEAALSQAASGAAASLGLSLDSIRGLLAGQYGFYVCKAELGRGSGVESAAFFEAGAAGKTLFQALAQATGAQRGGASLVEPFAGGLILPGPLGASFLALASVKDALVVAWPINAARNAITRVQTPPREPLASLPAFRSIGQSLAADSDAFLYASPQALISVLEAQGVLPAPARAALGATGLDSVASLAAGLRVNGAILFTATLRVQGERRGLLRLAAAPAPGAAPRGAGALASLLMAAVFSPNDAEDKSPAQKEREIEEALRRGAAQTKAKDESTAKAGGEEAPTAEAKGGAARRRGPGQRLIRGALERGEQIPPDVARFTTFRIEPPLAWEVFQEIGAVFAPKETQAAAARLQEVAKRAGARDAAELLGLLGKRAVVFTRYVKPYQNADAEQTVCVFEAADRNACDQRLAALRQNWPEAFGDKRVAEGDYFVYGCRLNGEELFYCLSESHLIVANNARAALDYIRFAGFDMSALAAQDAFALAMAKLPPQEQRVFATYHNPAPEFLYRTDRMRSNILDPAVEHAVRATPLASLFVTAVKGLRNTQALALLLPVSASALASTPSEITFTSYHAGP